MRRARRAMIAVVLLSLAAILLLLAHQAATVHGPVGPTVSGRPR